MKRIIIIICFAMTVHTLFAQPVAIVKLDSVCDPPAGLVTVSLTLETISNPGGNNLISSYGVYIQYDGDVLGDIVTFVNYNPQFPSANYLTNIVLNVPEPGWNTIAIIYAAAVSGSAGYNGMVFMDLQFNYIGPPAASDLILMGAGMNDDLGNPYDVTCINGYVGPCIEQEPTATLKIGDVIIPQPGTALVPIICEEIETVTGNNNVTIQWFIRYYPSTLYAGEPGNPATLLNFSPLILEECISSIILEDTPWNNINTIAFTSICPSSGEIYPGDKFFDIQFTLIGNNANIYWTALGSDDTEMYDDEGNEYYLTLKHGYIGPELPTATLKIGTIYDPLPGTVLVPITCEAINNPLIGSNLVSSWGWYIAYDTSVLYAGEPNSPATLANYNPEFSQSSYLTNIVADNPAPGWNTIAIIYSCACSGEVYPGDKFFDIQFNYNEGTTEYPNIIWTSLNYFSTNMADEEGNEFLLTLLDGYAGLYNIYDVLFHVTDDTGMPLEGALVAIDTLSVLTDTGGLAAFSLMNGNYDYTISKDGYLSETGSFIVADSAITIEETLNPWYGVTFHVTAYGYDIEGAMVTVGNDSIATNSSGIAVFNLPNGSYSYSVTKTGYADEEGTFTVAGAPMQINVEMQHCWEVTIHAVSGGIGLTDYIVIIGSDTTYNGTICLPDGSYNFTVIAPGYYPNYGTITVSGSPLFIVVIMMPLLYDVTFFINCCGEPLAGVSITIGSITVVTDASGYGNFYLPLGSYTYNVGNISGIFTVPPPVYIELDICGEITFHVTNDQGNPIPGVDIEIDGENLVTDFNGEADICLQAGTYSYTVTKFGYISQTGSIEVDTIPQTVEIVMMPVTYEVTFICGVSCENQFNGWHCQINGQTLSSGETIYLPAGMWNTSLSWLGCWPVGGVIYVQGSTVITCMGMGEPHVTFHVSSTQCGNLQNATVMVDTFALMTNSSGEATFCLPGGNHNYTIIKEGFDTLSGSFNYTDYCQDTLIGILMNPVTVANINSSDFRLYPNPSDGKFYLENLNQTGDLMEISVMDVTGRIVYQNKSAINDNAEIDLTGKPKGLYFLLVNSGNMIISRKLIVH